MKQMKQHEMKLNYDILLADSPVSSMDTYRMDPYRKKQLETIQKSIKQNHTIDSESQRLPYFASQAAANLVK